MVSLAEMTFTGDINIVTILAIFAQSVAFIVFLFRTHDTARSSKELAEKAHKRIDDLDRIFGERIDVLTASIALVRETYADKTSLRDMEDRITKAIVELGKRFDALLLRSQDK